MRQFRFSIMILLMALNLESSTSSFEQEQQLEKKGVPISLVLRRSSETEEEGPILMRRSELDQEELASFPEQEMPEGAAVGFVKLEKSKLEILVRDLYLLPSLTNQGFEIFIAQILGKYYSEQKVIVKCSVRTS